MNSALPCTVRILFGFESWTCRSVHIYTGLRSNEIDIVSLLEDPLQLHLFLFPESLPEVSEMESRADRVPKSAIGERMYNH
jgi:hypothetical protein